ncbi:hypothetical protein LguiA_022955 [Lonicera macranthoides]
MASLGPQNWGCINGQDDLDQFEVSKIDGALLLSLLDESQVDHDDQDCDNERLSSVIRSLEAEINQSSFMELEWDDNWVLPGGQVDGQDCSSSNGLNFDWRDLDEVDSVYVNRIQDHMEGVIEFGGVKDYYSEYCYENPMEESGFDSLWHETNAPML